MTDFLVADHLHRAVVIIQGEILVVLIRAFLYFLSRLNFGFALKGRASDVPLRASESVRLLAAEGSAVRWLQSRTRPKLLTTAKVFISQRLGRNTTEQ